MTQPNLLLIVLDTQRRDRLSLYGGPRETSPNIDAFADRAAVYDRAISAAQWTVPSHASMFTGVYPSAHGLTEAHRVLSPRVPTLPEQLRSAGYDTVGFCNNPLVGVLDHGLTRGFDSFYNYAGGAINRPFARQWPSPIDAAIKQWRKAAKQLGNQFAQREWLFRLSLNPLFTPIWTRLINYKGSSANSISDLIGYFEQQRAGGQTQPVFAFLNLMGTHLPYRPPQDALRHVAPTLDKASYRYMADFNADAARWASPADAALEDWQKHALEAFYDAEIFAQDRELGRLFDYLKRSGALRDTVVVIVSDHGEGHGDHGYFGHSFVVNQELVHVPLIISSPDGVNVGQHIDENISTRRIYHTLLAAAGCHPEDPLALWHAGAEGDTAYSEAFPPQTFLSVMRYRNAALIDALNLSQVRRAVYHGQRKLTLVGADTDALYDPASDPHEQHNLAADHPATVEHLRGLLDHFINEAAQQRDALSALAEDAALTPQMLEHLRALGYIE
ncbi:MAG: sulfatase-like hydrolase/transferase [Anaerolineae bacterium]|jgi:arylsulfatase A-like enzyme|nr:sulfatase-like hydrolase/transferase [Anaerolineae bacterium]